MASVFDPLSTTQLTEDELRAAVEAAADWGTYVLAHAYHDRSVNRCIDAGVKVIEHGALVSEETVRRMAEEGVVWSIQGFLFHGLFSDPSTMPSYFSAAQKRKAAQLVENFPRVAGWARKHGVYMVSGGDTFGAAYVHRNIENVVIETELGFTPYEALLHATGNPGRLLKNRDFMAAELDPYPEGSLGVIEPGGYADLLIVDGNPLEDLTVLRDYRTNLVLIMKDGEVFKNTL